MNLIDAALTADAASAMQNIFDSFKRTDPITFYKNPEKTFVSFDPSFDPDFPEHSSSFTETTQSQSFQCRVWYLDQQPMDKFVGGGEETGVKSEALYNRVKMQMEPDAFEFLKDSVRFILWGEEYQIFQTWRRIGILGSIQFYEVILQRVN